MPEYLSPGVYVEEIDTGSKPIEGVSTSTAGFVGVAERGPVNVPMLVTSVGEYSRLFGGRLPLPIFQNANGPHCFLPHAVEGFFGNGGKRLFVTRVIDDGAAQRAEFDLHDRGGATSAETLLLRNAGEGTGTALSTVPLYVVATNLSGGGVLANGDAIRIGDGSAAEYMTVDVVGGTATDVPLDFPLARSHAQAPLPAFDVQSLTLPAPTAFTMNPLTTGGPSTRVGTLTISLNGAPADILLLTPGDLLEIGGGGRREFRFVRAVTPIDASNARIRLDSPVMLSHAAAAPDNAVNRYALGALTGDGHLEMDAAAGDRVAFLSPLPAAYVPNTVLVFGFSDPVGREARVMGSMFGVPVAGVSGGVYPSGSVVEPVLIGDAQRSVLTGAGTTLTLNDQTLLGPGMTLQLGTAPAGTLETVTIDHIDATTNDIILTAAPTFAHPAGDPAVPAFLLKRLTADVAAGSTVIALGNRQLLTVGDVVRIDDGTSTEFATIAALPNQSGMAPDEGPVVLGSALTLPHAGPTTTTPGALVRVQTPAVPDLTKPASALAFATRNLDDTIVVTNGTGYLSGDHLRITTTTGQVAIHRITAAPAALTPQPVTVTDLLQRRHAAGSVIAQRDPIIQVQALDAGMWGNRLRVSAEDEPTGVVARTTITFNGGSAQIRLASAAGVESGTILELFDPADDTPIPGGPVKVESVDRTANYLITLAAPGLLPPHLTALAAGPVAVRSREFRLTVWLLNQPDPARPQRADPIDSEMFRNLSMDPRHSRYVQRIIGDINGPVRREDRRPEGESAYVRVHDLAQDLLEPGRTQALHGIRPGPEALIDILPTGRLRAARHPLAGGDDSVASMSDAMYIGLDNVQPELRTGLFSFTAEDDISIVAVPGRTGPDLQGRLIEHCELMRYRFAVLDSSVPPGDSLNDVQFQRQQFDTKYAGLYYPWILIPDPFPVNPANVALVPIPPSGHVTGVYARTDIERGVHKAPANEVVRGVLGLQRIINAGEHDILNPYPVNINVIRDFRPNNRGIRVWGARVITSDSDYKYVNVRRLLIFIEKSLERGLQWVVFEPNADPLWARVVRSISNFLTVVWRNGALEGTKKEEAFYVRCDRTTMTQTDIDSGRLICVIGVAPVKPAEFVIIRIGLWTAHADE